MDLFIDPVVVGEVSKRPRLNASIRYLSVPFFFCHLGTIITLSINFTNRLLFPMLHLEDCICKAPTPVTVRRQA